MLLDLCTAWGDIVTRDTPFHISPMLVGSPNGGNYDDNLHLQENTQQLWWPTSYISPLPCCLVSPLRWRSCFIVVVIDVEITFDPCAMQSISLKKGVLWVVLVLQDYLNLLCPCLGPQVLTTIMLITILTIGVEIKSLDFIQQSCW